MWQPPKPRIAATATAIAATAAAAVAATAVSTTTVTAAVATAVSAAVAPAHAVAAPVDAALLGARVGVRQRAQRVRQLVGGHGRLPAVGELEHGRGAVPRARREAVHA